MYIFLTQFLIFMLLTFINFRIFNAILVLVFYFDRGTSCSFLKTTLSDGGLLLKYVFYLVIIYNSPAPSNSS